MRRCALLLALALSSLAFAPAPFPRSARPKKAPLLLMQGTWTQVGRPSVKLIVTPTTFEYHNQGGGANKYGMRFDATRNPPTYDLLNGERVGWVGIYKVEGDTLTVYYTGAGRARPTSFEQNGYIKEVFTRVR